MTLKQKRRWVLVGIGIARLLRVNIWYGGPLDLRLDSDTDQGASQAKQR